MTEERQTAVATIRVNLECDGRRQEVMVATDWPVASLVPDLLRNVYGPQGAETAGRLSWGLGFPSGRPFGGVSTLADHRVSSGAALRLERVDAWQVAAPPQARSSSPNEPAPKPALANAVQPTQETMSPSQRTDSVLPPEVALIERLRLTLGSVFVGRQTAAEEQPGELEAGTTVSQTRLTVPPRPSVSERVRFSWRDSDYWDRLDRAIRSPQLRRCVTIAMMSPKGGVGKTTLTALLGSMFAMTRRDRIVAVDANPDFGSLGRTLTPEHAVFVDDLLDVLDSPELTVTELDANLGRGAHGMMVLPAPIDPARMARLDEDAYTRVTRRLQDMVGVILLDCGTGLQEPASRAALSTADQVLMITDAEPATASLVTEAATALGRENVPIWLVVNKLSRSGATRLDLPALETYIPQARGLVTVPLEPRAAQVVAAGLFDWRDAPGSWRRSVREVAADLVAAWPSLDVTIEGRPAR
jgi:MinD-like ATPase involved in chromosome partitioning or flagellar assembly